MKHLRFPVALLCALSLLCSCLAVTAAATDAPALDADSDGAVFASGLAGGTLYVASYDPVTGQFLGLIQGSASIDKNVCLKAIQTNNDGVPLSEHRSLLVIAEADTVLTGGSYDNVTVTAAVGDGDVTLEGVTVGGALTLYGGEYIVLSDCTLQEVAVNVPAADISTDDDSFVVTSALDTPPEVTCNGTPTPVTGGTAAMVYVVSAAPTGRTSELNNPYTFAAVKGGEAVNVKSVKADVFTAPASSHGFGFLVIPEYDGTTLYLETATTVVPAGDNTVVLNGAAVKNFPGDANNYQNDALTYQNGVLSVNGADYAVAEDATVYVYNLTATDGNFLSTVSLEDLTGMEGVISLVGASKANKTVKTVYLTIVPDLVLAAWAYTAAKGAAKDAPAMVYVVSAAPTGRTSELNNPYTFAAVKGDTAVTEKSVKADVFTAPATSHGYGFLVVPEYDDATQYLKTATTVVPANDNAVVLNGAAVKNFPGNAYCYANDALTYQNGVLSVNGADYAVAEDATVYVYNLTAMDGNFLSTVSLEDLTGMEGVISLVGKSKDNKTVKTIYLTVVPDPVLNDWTCTAPPGAPVETVTPTSGGAPYLQCGDGSFQSLVVRFRAPGWSLPAGAQNMEDVWSTVKLTVGERVYDVDGSSVVYDASTGEFLFNTRYPFIRNDSPVVEGETGTGLTVSITPKEGEAFELKNESFRYTAVTDEAMAQEGYSISYDEATHKFTVDGLPGGATDYNAAIYIQYAGSDAINRSQLYYDSTAADGTTRWYGYAYFYSVVEPQASRIFLTRTRFAVSGNVMTIHTTASRSPLLAGRYFFADYTPPTGQVSLVYVRDEVQQNPWNIGNFYYTTPTGDSFTNFALVRFTDEKILSTGGSFGHIKTEDGKTVAYNPPYSLLSSAITPLMEAKLLYDGSSVYARGFFYSSGNRDSLAHLLRVCVHAATEPYVFTKEGSVYRHAFDNTETYEFLIGGPYQSPGWNGSSSTTQLNSTNTEGVTAWVWDYNFDAGADGIPEIHLTYYTEFQFVGA